jgi:hypothetical protein
LVAAAAQTTWTANAISGHRIKLGGLFVVFFKAGLPRSLLAMEFNY